METWLRRQVKNLRRAQKPQAESNLWRDEFANYSVKKKKKRINRLTPPVQSSKEPGIHPRLEVRSRLTLTSGQPRHLPYACQHHTQAKREREREPKPVQGELLYCCSSVWCLRENVRQYLGQWPVGFTCSICCLLSRQRRCVLVEEVCCRVFLWSAVVTLEGPQATAAHLGSSDEVLSVWGIGQASMAAALPL